MNVLSTQNEYQEKDLILFFILVIGFFLFGLFIKKIVYKHFLKQEFSIFPTLTVRGITNIAMIIAMNSALIFVIAWLSKGVLGAMFQVYPGSRMLIENTLIKIGGIIFGPILGIFIGATTDILTVMLISSTIHYGYWFIAILNGFLGGLIHILINYKKDDKKVKSNLVCVLLVFLTFMFFWNFLGRNLTSDYAVVNLLSNQIRISRIFILSTVFAIAFGIIAILLFGLLANFLIVDGKHKERRWVKYCNKNNLAFQVLSIIFVAYILLDLTTLPVFDIVISSLPYEQFLIMRLTMMIPHLITSFWIIWSIYKLHNNIKPQDEKSITEESKITSGILKEKVYNKLMH